MTTNENERLREAFGFTQDDLVTNRAGKLTARQVAFLVEKKESHKAQALIILVAFFLLVAVSLGNVYASGDPMGWILFAVFALFGLVFVGVKYYEYDEDIKQHEVESLCGKTTLNVKHRGRYSIGYELELEGQKFRLANKSQLLALRDGESYCVYYTPNSKSVFAVEHARSSGLETKTVANRTLSQQRFGEHAQNYVTSQTHAKGADLERLVELAQPEPHWHVLDVATGGGHTALTFAPHVASVVASDITPQMLQAAEAYITGRGTTNVEFRHAAAENLPFDDATFDLVTCRIAPHHFDDAARFVKEAARVVKPGCLVLVQDQLLPDDDLIGRYVETFEKLRDPSHNHAFNEAEWRAMFADAGLAVESVDVFTKSHSFDEWTATQRVTSRTKACLVALLRLAPPEARKWLEPRDLDTPDATFVNHHIIVAGRASECTSE